MQRELLNLLALLDESHPSRNTHGLAQQDWFSISAENLELGRRIVREMLKGKRPALATEVELLALLKGIEERLVELKKVPRWVSGRTRSLDVGVLDG